MKLSRTSTYLLLTSCIAIAGCKSGGSTPSGPPPLVIFSQSEASDSFYPDYDQQMAAAAKKYSSNINFQEVNAEGSATKQIAQIKDAIAKKPQYLLVHPVSMAVLPEIKAAHDAGICVFLLDCYVKDSPADSYAGVGDSGIAILECSSTASDIGKGTALVIPGPPDNYVSQCLTTISAGVHHKSKRVIFVFGDNCNFQEDKAKSFVAKYLAAKKPLNAIIAIDGNTAIGAAEAVQEAKVPDIKIYTAGANRKALIQDIQDGAIEETFDIHPGGPLALDAIVGLAPGAKPQKEYVVNADIEDKDRAAKFLQMHPNLPN